MNGIRTFIFLAAASLACVAAHAQWQWIDKDGRKVFSDRAPPPGIPDKNILKQPGGASRAGAALPNAAPALAASAQAASAAGGVAGAEAPQLGTVDKDLAEKKKQAEAAEAAKVKAAEERVVKAKAENCERARGNKSLMESGVRLAQTDAKGERVILDDAARAVEAKRAQTAIDSNCK